MPCQLAWTKLHLALPQRKWACSSNSFSIPAVFSEAVFFSDLIVF